VKKKDPFNNYFKRIEAISMTDSQLMAAANRGIRLKGRLRKVRRITFAHAAHGAAKEISVIGFHCLTYFSYSIRL
jgi:hypothetical protein